MGGQTQTLPKEMRSMPSAENAADTRSWWKIDPPKAVKKLADAAWKADVLMMKFESEDLWRLFKANSEFSQICFFEVKFHPKLITEMNSLRCGPFGVAWLVGWLVCSWLFLCLRLYFSTKCCGQQSALLRTPFGWYSSTLPDLEDWWCFFMFVIDLSFF